mmetsp:Transcript_36806/g.78140  ORF Transcript_36806/g.78140 Transcript_36806/m.78140 type:complete len:139 (+) Transcript_36806:455-871(+)
MAFMATDEDARGDANVLSASVEDALSTLNDLSCRLAQDAQTSSSPPLPPRARCATAGRSYRTHRSTATHGLLNGSADLFWALSDNSGRGMPIAFFHKLRDFSEELRVLDQNDGQEGLRLRLGLFQEGLTRFQFTVVRQ